MEVIRYGNDINVTWSVFGRNGSKYSLSDKVRHLWLVNGPRKKEITSYSVQGRNQLVFVIDDAEINRLGVYKLVLQIREPDSVIEDSAYDLTQVFQVVSETYPLHTNKAVDGQCDVSFKSILKNTYISELEGESAYEIAVRHGFEGSEEDWLESLIGLRSVEQSESSQASGGRNKIAFTLADGTVTEVSVYNGAAGERGSDTLSGLSDTAISSPVNGQYLKWNGSRWVNSSGADYTYGSGIKIIGNIISADIQGIASGLITAGYSLSGGEGGQSGVTTLRALSDVSLTSPVDGQVLTYDASISRWVAKTVQSGGGGGQGGGGDIDPSVLANYVTIAGAETITGAKTFTAQTVLTDTLIVGSGATTLAPSTPGAKKRIYFGDADHYLELNSNGYYFFGAPGVYTNGFMSAGGIGSGGEGGGGGVSGDYLPLAGGRMTGAIRLTTEDDMAGTGSIRAVHISDDQEVLDGYIGYRNNGALRIHAGGQIYIRPAGKTSGGLNISGVAARFNDRIIDTYKSLYSSEEETEDYGILVKTTLKSTSECFPTFHITGMDYNGSTIDTFVSFWMGASSTVMNKPSRVSLGTELGVIYAFVYDPEDYTSPTGSGGRVYLWFSRPSRYSTIYISLYNARSEESESGVESIEYAPMPSNDYIARRTAINPGSTITGSYSAVKISAVEGGVANVNTGVYGNRYGIKIDATGRAYVDIPSGSGGGGSGTTYYAGTGLSLSGSTFNLTKATTDALGGVKAATSSSSAISTTTASSGTYYSVGVDVNGKMYVRVPSTGGTTVSWGTEQNNTVKLTVGGVEKTVCLDGYSSGSSPSGSYLALSGGTMAGTINAQAVIPKTNSTSQSNGYELGSSSYYWRNLYSRRIYLSSNVYIYYDSTNNCIRTNAPIVSDSYISAGGVSST